MLEYLVYNGPISGLQPLLMPAGTWEATAGSKMEVTKWARDTEVTNGRVEEVFDTREVTVILRRTV